jgi:catechol 2,3-dioxygenase-like lactoylglutathione lyase family enzyme
MPKLDGILETAIHTEDMVRARAFYEGVLGLEPIYSDNRLPQPRFKDFWKDKD